MEFYWILIKFYFEKFLLHLHTSPRAYHFCYSLFLILIIISGVMGALNNCFYFGLRFLAPKELKDFLLYWLFFLGFFLIVLETSSFNQLNVIILHQKHLFYWLAIQIQLDALKIDNFLKKHKNEVSFYLILLKAFLNQKIPNYFH